jgi:putative ABC transport system ATP-binding protein
MGHDVWGMSDDEMEAFRLHHCSYIFQGYNLFPALTAREQLEIVLKWGEGCSGREARKRADHVLTQLGMANKAHLRPAQLSGGEKQRVAIGRALVKNPTFVFADEPTAALDWENGQHVISLLTENARERGAMVLVVTHDPRLIPFADRVLDLVDGRLVQEGNPERHSSRVNPLEHTPFPPTMKRSQRLLLQLPQPVRV